MKKYTRVIMESPYAGDIEKNTRYARDAMRSLLLHGKAPMVSHLLYTQEGVLDDTNKEERAIGIDAGLAWGEVAEATYVFFDLGISRGMRYGIERARSEGRPVYFCSISSWCDRGFTREAGEKRLRDMGIDVSGAEFDML